MTRGLMCLRLNCDAHNKLKRAWNGGGSCKKKSITTVMRFVWLTVIGRDRPWSMLRANSGVKFRFSRNDHSYNRFRTSRVDIISSQVSPQKKVESVNLRYLLLSPMSSPMAHSFNPMAPHELPCLIRGVPLPLLDLGTSWTWMGEA